MIYAIDRFEREQAILINEGLLYHIPRASLPKSAQEGDCLRYRSGTWIVDKEETLRRKQEMRSRLQSLFTRNRSRT